MQSTTAPRLLDSIEQSILRRRLLYDGQPILVAVSGGLDSIALLHILHELASKRRWRLTVAHLNHQLRGRSSDADERSVRRVAKMLRLPIVVEGANVRKFAARQKLSLEMAARKLRHDFLARTALLRRTSAVALAHHADDQLELFFLRLFRGSGGEGLAGMKWCTPSPANPKVILVRPLLDLPKETVRKFAAERKIRFREDASNECLDFQRNRIRHELLPLLRRYYQPSLDKTILRVMEIIGSEAEFVTQRTAEWLELVPSSKSGRQLDLLRPGAPESVPARTRAKQHAGKDAGALEAVRLGSNLREGKSSKSRPRTSIPFDKLPIALQRRGIQLQLIGLKVGADFELVEALRLAAEHPVAVAAQEGSPSATGGRCVFRDSRGLVHFVPHRITGFASGCLPVKLGAGTGDVTLDGVQIRWRLGRRHGRQLPKCQPGSEHFDAEKIGSHILLRHWQPGDRFQPIGMQQLLKLQDFFTNEKVPRPQRHQLIVATSEGGEVFWVEGLRISERFKLTERTRRSLQWRWERI